MSEIVKQMDEIISEALDDHDTIIPLLSGGKDSMMVTHHAYSRWRKYVKHIVFLNTGIAIPSTRKFVIEECKKQNWKLNMLWPKEGETFRDFVLKFGFPGKGAHPYVMGYLKYHPMRTHFMSILDENPIYVSGVRKSESKRRMQNYKTPFVKDGNLHFVASAFYVSSGNVWDYVHTRNLQISSAYTIFGFSGDCECGSFGKKWELKLLEKNVNQIYQTIHWLENQLQLHGTYEARKWPTWASGPDTLDISMQQDLDKYMLVQDMVCSQECRV